MSSQIAASNVTASQMSDLRSSGTLPGVMPTRDSMLGVLMPQGPRPMLTTFQSVSMPPVPSQQPVSQSISNNSSMAGMLSSLKMPSHDMASLADSMRSPIAPAGDYMNSQQATPVSQSPSQSSQEKPNMLENMAASIAPGNLGNMWTDIKRGVNPILQFAKQILNIVTASAIAAFNFLIRPNSK